MIMMSTKKETVTNPKAKEAYIQCPNCSGYGTKGYNRVVCPSCKGKGVLEVPAKEEKHD